MTLEFRVRNKGYISERNLIAGRVGSGSGLGLGHLGGKAQCVFQSGQELVAVHHIGHLSRGIGLGLHMYDFRVSISVRLEFKYVFLRNVNWLGYGL